MNRRYSGRIRGIVSLAVILAILAGAGAFLFSYFRPVVTVSEAIEGPVVQAFYSTGTIQPQREYSIRSNTAGTVTDVRIDKGARVRKGDVLTIVTDPALIFAASKAQAELDEKLKRADEKSGPIVQEYDAKIKAAEDQLEIVKREVARLQNLRELDAGAQRDLDVAMDRLKQVWSDGESHKAQRSMRLFEAQREIEVARAAVNTARWNLEQQELKSPIDGVVLDRPTSTGTRVAVNEVLMRIADVTPATLVMRAAVDEEDVTKVRVDQVVRMVLYSFSDTAFTGHVTKIHDQADADRRTFEVEIKLDRIIDRLAPGMTGELAFILAEKDRAVVIPSQAVQNKQVWTIRNGELQQVDVQIGIASVERTEILSGLRPGDRIVISPVGALSAGQSVRVNYVDPRTAAGLNKPPPVTEAFKGFSN